MAIVVSIDFGGGGFVWTKSDETACVFLLLASGARSCCFCCWSQAVRGPRRAFVLDAMPFLVKFGFGYVSNNRHVCWSEV
jgi:hypothetical protein